MSSNALSVISMALLPVGVSLLIVWLRLEEKEEKGSLSTQSFFIVSCLSFCGFLATLKLIPIVAELCLKRKLSGLDINKNGTTPM